MPDDQVAAHEVALGTVVYLHFDAGRRLPLDDAIARTPQQLDGTALRTPSASAGRHNTSAGPPTPRVVRALRGDDLTIEGA